MEIELPFGIMQWAKAGVENGTRTLGSEQMTDLKDNCMAQQAAVRGCSDTGSLEKGVLYPPSSILSHISFVEQERARNPGGEKDFDSHVSTCVLCSFWWMQIDSEDLTVRKALRGNLAPPTFDPLLLLWKLRPREGRWPAQGE